MTDTPDRTMAEQREKLADRLAALSVGTRYGRPMPAVRPVLSPDERDMIVAALRPPTPDQSIGEQQILDEANRRYVTDSYRCAFIEGAGWGLHNRAAADQSRAGEPVDPFIGLDARLDRLLLTASDGGRFVLGTDSAKNIVGIVREWLRTPISPTEGEPTAPLLWGMTVEKLRKTISDEWGSHLCYEDKQNFRKQCDPLGRCRCADIARAIVSEHVIGPPSSPAIGGAREQSATQRTDEDVALFNNARAEAIEECAKVADRLKAYDPGSEKNYGKAIRALSQPQEKGR